MKKVMYGPILPLLLSGLFSFCAVPSLQAQSLTPEAYIRLMNLALNDVDNRIPDNARQRTEFALNLFFAHEAWIKGVPADVLVKAVDAFKEAGVDRVDINPGQYPWTDGDAAVIAKYDAAVGRIRKLGLKLSLNPFYSATYHPVASFAEWQKRALALYADLAARYKPDNFVVLHEPGTMAARMGQDVTVAEWTGFVRALSLKVKEKSPGTRVGAGGLASDQTAIEAFIKMAAVEFITLDIYATADLPVCNAIIQKANAAGKPVYIGETWRPGHAVPGFRL